MRSPLGIPLLIACATLLAIPALAAAAPAEADPALLLAGIFAAAPQAGPAPGMAEPVDLQTSTWYNVCLGCAQFADCTSACAPGYAGTCYLVRYCRDAQNQVQESICRCTKI